VAEGVFRAVAGDRFDVASAGTEATHIQPLAIRVMDEKGTDLTGHTSKNFKARLGHSWDYLITPCDGASEQCPVLPGRTVRFHWSFDDPSQATGTDQDRLETFRRVHEEIITKLTVWLDDQEKPTR